MCLHEILGTSSHILHEIHRRRAGAFRGGGGGGGGEDGERGGGDTRIKRRYTLLYGLPSSGTRPSRERTGIPGHSPASRKRNNDVKHFREDRKDWRLGIGVRGIAVIKVSACSSVSDSEKTAKSARLSRARTLESARRCVRVAG